MDSRPAERLIIRAEVILSRCPGARSSKSTVSWQVSWRNWRQGDSSGRTALDLYAGVGLFSLPLAGRFEEVTAADSSARAIRALRFNAERAGRRVRVVHANVEEFLPSVTEPVDFVVADPPRAGLGPRVTAELARIKPSSLTIVSCDPATLARDLKSLAAGGFQIESITLVDQFPQTFHLETVVRLRPRQATQKP